MHRRYSPLLLVGVLMSMGASHRTQNFVVHAPTAQVAQQVGQYAEHYRREKAIEWLGREMPNWPQPCPLHVTVTADRPSGATSFHFGQGRVLDMKMQIQGPFDRLLASVLPHEITHTVFAHHFGCPVPRWADEGGSVLSEDQLERERHDRLTRKILNHGQQIPMRRLFSLKEYPREVMCLYAQGFSICDYLVRRSDRRTFLNFVGQGMNQGWDQAVASYYGHRNVEELEEAWLKHLRDTRKQPAQPSEIIAQGQGRGENPVASAAGSANTQGSSRGQTVVRLTVPPAQPIDPPPVARGAMPTPDQQGQLFGNPPPPPPPPPGYARGVMNPGWQVVTTPPIVVPLPPAPPPPPVQLGAPQFVPAGVPPRASPIGFPQ
jgi:hypothetical protein